MWRFRKNKSVEPEKDIEVERIMGILEEKSFGFYTNTYPVVYIEPSKYIKKNEFIGSIDGGVVKINYNLRYSSSPGLPSWYLIDQALELRRYCLEKNIPLEETEVDEAIEAQVVIRNQCNGLIKELKQIKNDRRD